MANHANMKLGRKPRRIDRRTLKLARYLTPALPAPPASADWTKGVSNFGMMLNGPNSFGNGVPSEGLGDCTIAAVAHTIQIWTLNTMTECTVPDSVVETYYEQWDGYDPENPSSDQGGDELTVLTDWRKNGFNGHRLDAFASVPVSEQQEIMQAVNLFGLVYIGINLPITAQTEDVWSGLPSDSNPDSQPGSWGGHAVIIVGYNADGVTIITWGQLKKATWAWIRAYCDEIYALISEDWLEANGKTPAGLDLATLQADLTLITS